MQQQHVEDTGKPAKNPMDSPRIYYYYIIIVPDVYYQGKQKWPKVITDGNVENDPERGAEHRLHMRPILAIFAISGAKNSYFKLH